MPKIGIDIYEGNKINNYNDVIDNIDFAILRVGYGVSYMPEKQKDSSFEKNYNEFYGKIQLGGYYYSYAKKIGDGEKEAQNCLKYLNGKEMQLPVFYDIEDKIQQSFPKDVLTGIVLEFVNTIEKAGYRAGVYCSKYWAEHKLDMNKLQNTNVWIASYGTNNGNIPSDSYKYNGKQNIWQYTSRGYVKGINGYVDMDILYNIVDNSEIVIPKPIYSGDETIRNIQNWLNNQYNSGLVVDGYYGNLTKKALIKALQTELNKQYNTHLVVDGIFGNLTKNACPNIRNGASGNITKLIQSALYCKGYNVEGIDGIFGNRTEREVRKFQSANGLLSDGIVGKNTFEKLFK